MKLRYFAKYVNLPFLLEHFYFFYFPEQVGRKDEIVQRLVIRGDYLLFCSLPFLHALIKMILSPIFITEFMSWVLITVVILYSTVMS